MIELPATPAPNSASPELIDYGTVLRPALGGPLQRIDRAGSRFRVSFTYPPMTSETARPFVSRLLRAKREGVRIEFPLLDTEQGLPGLPVVDGAGQTGTTLSLRGLVPGYAFKEGYWFSITDAAGQHYLHNCQAGAVASSGGTVTIEIEPALRAPFADGASVNVRRPQIEGLIDGDTQGWSISVNRLTSIEFTIEETA